MNLLKRSSPLPRGQQQSPLYGGRLTPSPHYQDTTHGSPLTHRTGVTSLLLQMGGENSAFKALVPSANFGQSINVSYDEDSDEEINVNDESDVEEERRLRERERSCSPVDVIEDSPKESQPLQLTKHDRD